MDPPIVITGGSIHIELPDSVFQPDPAGKGKYKCDDRKIKRIEISGAGIQNYVADAKNNNITIKIYYETT